MYPRVLGVLAGQDMNLSLLSKWAQSADIVIAADAGLDRLLAVGVEPDFAVGDFDSATRLEEFGRERRHAASEEETDCDKLLSLARELGFGSVTLASLEGDQLDHMLATLHSASKSPLAVRAALRTGVGWILNAGDEVNVATRPGRRVSLLPLEEVVGASLSGVKWPLADEPLHPSGRSGISNVSDSNEVAATIRNGSAFLFVGFPEKEMPLW
jgi:thiamine pyrophosphokinase